MQKARQTTKDLAELVRTANSHKGKHFTTAIIAAAGSSCRMRSTVSKLLLDIDGIPALARTLLAYQAASTVDEIVLVARREDFDEFLALAQKFHITKLKRITQGGATRQDSVRNALGVLSDRTKYVAIADGARCLITPQQIDSVNLLAYRTQAASAGVPSIDTVKIVDRKARTVSSPDRSTVWLAQTPQTFSLPLYRAAAYSAKEDGVEAPDDNALVERIGRPVYMVDCGKQNIKITSPEDIELSRAILSIRSKEDRS